MSYKHTISNAGAKIKFLWKNSIRKDKDLILALYYEELWGLYMDGRLDRKRLAEEATHLIERAKTKFQQSAEEV